MQPIIRIIVERNHICVVNSPVSDSPTVAQIQAAFGRRCASIQVDSSGVALVELL